MKPADIFRRFVAALMTFTALSAAASPLPSHLTPALRRTLIDYERGRYERPDHSLWVRIVPPSNASRLNVYVMDAPDGRAPGLCKTECGLLTIAVERSSFQVINDAYVETSQVAIAAPGSAERLYSANGAETSAAFNRIDPSVRRYVIDDMQSVFDANSEKRDPSSIVSAPLVLEEGGKAVAVKISRGWLCSATGMCPLLILVREGAGFRKVGDLEGQGPLRALPHYTNGYPDLTDWVHDSAFTNYEVRYWFNGKRYVAGKRRNGWVEDRGGGEIVSRRLPELPEGKLLIGNELGERLYK